jgi:hypothetical protein
MTPEEMQDQLVLIVHHLEDAMKGIKEGDKTYTRKSLLDIAEAVTAIAESLPEEEQNDIMPGTDIQQIADTIEDI